MHIFSLMTDIQKKWHYMYQNRHDELHVLELNVQNVLLINFFLSDYALKKKFWIIKSTTGDCKYVAINIYSEFKRTKILDWTSDF